MLVSVKRRRSVTTKLDKLYVLFHDFTISEGFMSCSACEKQLEINIPEILWQVLTEKEFLIFWTTELAEEEKAKTSTEESAPRVLSHIEKNAVRYTASYGIRKLEQKYSTKPASKAVSECIMELQEMSCKLQREPNTEDREEKQLQQSSNKWTGLVNRGGLCFFVVNFTICL